MSRHHCGNPPGSVLQKRIFCQQPNRSFVKQRAPIQENSNNSLLKLSAGILGSAAAVTLFISSPALAVEPFLKSTGAKGPLVAEEEQLFRLRQQFEAEARDELNRAKEVYEEEARLSQKDMLCATPFGVDVVGITEFIALTGALVGGLSARRRKEELERLNEQLRTINTQLRQQARAGTLYAPGLTYAPPTSTAVRTSVPVQEPSIKKEDVVANITQPTVTPATVVPAVSVSYMSDAEDEMSPGAKQCLQALKEGKRFLKEKNGGSALVRFEKALMLAKSLGDKVKERRAVRGLAASSRIQGQGRQVCLML